MLKDHINKQQKDTRTNKRSFKVFFHSLIFINETEDSQTLNSLHIIRRMYKAIILTVT